MREDSQNIKFVIKNDLVDMVLVALADSVSKFQLMTIFNQWYYVTMLF